MRLLSVTLSIDCDNGQELFVPRCGHDAEALADELCRINNWKKITPMSGAHVPPPSLVGKDLPDLDWTEMPWKRDKLVLLVQRHFQGQEFGEEELAWIIDNMNPTEVLRACKKIVNKKNRVPGSLSRDALVIP